MAALISAAGSVFGAGLTVEAKGAFFVPADKAFRDSYKSGPLFGLELAYPVADNLSIWAGAEYFSKSGTLSFTGESTKIRIVPLYAGLKVGLSHAAVRPYLGVAGGYFLYRETNIIGTASGGALGFLGQFGVVVKLGKVVSLDVYGRYSYAKTKAKEPDILSAQIGGIEGGLGFVFTL